MIILYDGISCFRIAGALRPDFLVSLRRGAATASAASSQPQLVRRSKEATSACCVLDLQPDVELGPIEVKEAFFRLAKRFHPDAGSAEADPAKFASVRDAYKTLMESGTVEGVGVPGVRTEAQEEEFTATMEEFARTYDVRHTAPQHRQYLSFEGYGRGAPMQRQRQYDKHRAERAAARAAECRVEKLAWNEEKSAVVVDKKKAKDIKTRFGMERVVEDLIQESISRGEFETIQGKGKPLRRKDLESNPYSDFMTTKMNEILINNGYQPEWVELGTEIRMDMAEARGRLSLTRSKLGSYPFENPLDERDWEDHVNRFKIEWKIVNDKIWRFNLLVPTLNQQIIPTTADKELDRVLKDEDAKFRREPRPPEIEIHRSRRKSVNASGRDYVETPMDLFQQLLTNIFRWK